MGIEALGFMSERSLRALAIVLGIFFFTLAVFLATQDAPRDLEAFLVLTALFIVSGAFVAIAKLLKGESLRTAIAAMILGLPVLGWAASLFN